MNKIKYLNDGRKVVVIGEINSNESIVQEIFVTKDGDEIPSGERFTTKSLHDEPVMSYKDKRQKDLERSLDAIEERIKQARGKEKQALSELKRTEAICSFPRAVKHRMTKESLAVLNSLLNGTIEYVVHDTFSIKPPVPFKDAISYFEGYHDNRRFDGIKLISLYGKSNGDLSYQINRYSDGSGSSSRIFPFNDWDSAIAKIKEIALASIEKGYFSATDYIACKNMGITFTKAIKKSLKKKYFDDMEETNSKHQQDEKKRDDSIKLKTAELNEAFAES